MKSRPPLWLLVLITISGTMAMHMFVPALPDAARGLHAGVGQMQMAVSIYIVGLAVGQLVYGPLSDAYGRRPLLMVGLALYTLGGLCAALAPDLPTLLAARLLQAMGGCAGLALGRAIVRDTSSSDTAVRQLALLNLMIMVGPGLSPMVGGAVTGAFGWRATFVLLTAIGALTLWFSWRLLPETGRPTGVFGPRTLLADYRELLGSPRYVGFALGGGICTTCIFAFVAALPFIFTQELHQPIHLVGVYAGLMVLGMGAGNALTSKLVHRVGSETLLRTGNTISIFAGTAFLAQALLGGLTVAGLVATMLVFTCGIGMTSPAAMGKALSVDMRLIGSAAGLYGFCQMASGAVSTSISALGNDPAVMSSSVLLAAVVLSRLFLEAAMRLDRRERS